jgi:hypothetical protein
LRSASKHYGVLYPVTNTDRSFGCFETPDSTLFISAEATQIHSDNEDRDK